MAQYTADEEIQTCYLKLQGQHLIVSYLPLQELNGTLLCVKNITSNIHHVYRMRNTFVAVMLVFFGCSDIFYQCDRKTSVKTAVRDSARNPPRAGRRSGRGDRALRTG